MLKDLSKVLLITDLDGTLLPHNKKLLPDDINAINRFINDGGRFSIATGRPIQSVAAYLKELKVTDPIILYNGSAIYDTISDKFLWCDYLNENARKLIIDVLKTFPDASAEILTENEIYTFQKNNREEYHISITNTNPVECSIDEAGDKWLKALFAIEPERIDSLMKFIADQNYNDFNYVQSCAFFYEVLPKGNSKGTALKRLRDMAELNNYTIVAVGDYANDIEMLEYADIGIATANATDDVKAIADIVLDKTCDENAIASVINYIYNKYGHSELK